MLPHLLLVAAIVFSVYSQLMMKSRALVHVSASGLYVNALHYLISMATDWRVVSAAWATFLAGFCWLPVIQRLNLTYAFPFMALSFVLIPLESKPFFGDQLP